MYRPGPPPKGDEYAAREFEKVAAEINQPAFVQLKVLHVAPEKPRDGMVICADGTDLDPGSGAGFYGYSGGAWVFLG